MGSSTPPVGRSNPSGGQQGLFRDDQIGQGEEHLMLGAILLQPLVAQLAIVKVVLDDVKDVLDPAADVRLDPLNALGQVFHLTFRQSGHLASLGGDVPFHLAVLECFALLGAGITRIGKYDFLLTVQQVARLGDIRHVGGRGGGAVYQPGFLINPNVGLGAKVILLALAGVTHFGVACPRLVLGRGWCGDDGGIHQGALVHQQATLTQHRVDRVKDGLGQAQCFQQVAKLEQRGGIRYRFAAQIEAEKAAKRLTIIDGIFQRLVGQPKSLLQEVEAQHQFQAQRRPTRTLVGLGIIMRTQLFQQPRPRHHDLHLRQETVPAGRLALGVILGLGEGDLLEHGTGRGQIEDGRGYITCNPYGLNQSVSP